MKSTAATRKKPAARSSTAKKASTATTTARKITLAKKPANDRKKNSAVLSRPCVTEYVEWAYVPKIGRGVIATRSAKKGTVLERSPVIVAPVGDFNAKHGRDVALEHYLLVWDEKGEDKEYAVGLGYLMLYNHSSNPNAEFRYRYAKREIEMIALRDIKAGEEITHDYGGTWFKPRKED